MNGSIKEFMVVIPTNIVSNDHGIMFYENVKTIECRASDIKDVFIMYPVALKVQQKDLNY